MCLSIHATEANASIELSFTQETIFQKRNGATRITLDLLVENVGESAIQNLRVVIPHASHDASAIERAINKKESKALKAIQTMRSEQLQMVRLNTGVLALDHSPSHWSYSLLEHVDLVSGTQDGVIEIQRNQPVEDKLAGFVKHNWQLKQPDSCDEWTWLVFALTEFVVLDIYNDTSERERLLPHEKMWLRLEIEIPPTGLNKKSRIERIFARSWEYRQAFKSPGSVSASLKARFSKFRPESMQVTEELKSRIAEAKGVANKMPAAASARTRRASA